MHSASWMMVVQLKLLDHDDTVSSEKEYQQTDVASLFNTPPAAPLLRVIGKLQFLGTFSTKTANARQNSEVSLSNNRRIIFNVLTTCSLRWQIFGKREYQQTDVASLFMTPPAAPLLRVVGKLQFLGTFSTKTANERQNPEVSLSNNRRIIFNVPSHVFTEVAETSAKCGHIILMVGVFPTLYF
jgi:hypothetical protein